MSNVAHNAKAHAAQHQPEHVHVPAKAAPALKRPIFNNGPIHIKAAQSETGEDTFLDWGEPITLLRYDVTSLTEALQHRDPNQVRIALHSIETQMDLLKKYLAARDVIDLD